MGAKTSVEIIATSAHLIQSKYGKIEGKRKGIADSHTDWKDFDERVKYSKLYSVCRISVSGVSVWLNSLESGRNTNTKHHFLKVFAAMRWPRRFSFHTYRYQIPQMSPEVKMEALGPDWLTCLCNNWPETSFCVATERRLGPSVGRTVVTRRRQSRCR